MAQAADKEDKRPIVIKKKKVVGGGHHGGAWKVAYADFVTAMMAFFMVMWLITAVSKDQRAAIFDYFKNPSMEDGKAPKPAPGQMGPGGASTSPINLRGGLDAPRTNVSATPGVGAPVAPLDAPPDVDTAMKLAEEAEKKQLESLMEELKEAISQSQALAPYKDQLLLDITPEGLRIQIVDKQNRPMFDLGKSQLKDYTAQILKEVAKYLNTCLLYTSDVQVVGGLVEQQQLRVHHQRARQQRAPAPAARQVFIAKLAVEPELRQHDVGAGRDLPALEAEAVQPRLDHLANRGLGNLRDVLLHHRHAGSRPQPHAAGIRQKLSAGQPQS